MAFIIGTIAIGNFIDAEDCATRQASWPLGQGTGPPESEPYKKSTTRLNPTFYSSDGLAPHTEVDQ